ncbi:MAG: cation-transporting P-type ATPase [Candidatus Berkelbacteria bacterium]|nr:cation-transporting P-type ATPase [Candidatus Berkelbacteria bacterium]
MKNYAFYQWSRENCLEHFDVTAKEGLASAEAKTRLDNFGLNSLENFRQPSAILIFLRQFANFFVVLLFCAGVISYFVDGIVQSLMLFSIILINVILGFAQEYKAEKALASLKRDYASTCKVIRGGKLVSIPSETLVPGDLVLLEAGAKVPADLRIIEEESLRIDESSLTGESIPIGKNSGTLPLNTALADRRNMAFAATMVVAGHGLGLVVATGRNTEFGQIALLVVEKEEKTPLEKQVNYIGASLTKIAVVLSLIIFLLGYTRHFPGLELLTFTIALLVAVVPESLPTAITLALSVGVSQMAKKKAVVRKMAVIETLGMVDIIATDKTGTLTENQLVVEKAMILEKNKIKKYEINSKIKPDQSLIKFFTHGLACSNINLNVEDDFIGDPLEIAIAKSTHMLDKLSRFKEKSYRRILEIPFDSDKKFMAVLIESGNQKSLIAKGMTEKIVEFCQLDSESKKEILQECHELSRQGFRVIALADKHLGELKSSVLCGMQFRGLFALADQPRVGVKEAIAETISAGIRPIILTGDHPETAKYIASRIGLKVLDDEIILGQELQGGSKADLIKKIKNVKIFARVTPEDKINIVTLLQEQGFCVAMTGDGINDAPALRQAQAGIAMGKRGTDISKEAADIVLLDDHYGTIVEAVMYGRTIYDNIRNTLTFLLAGNLSELCLVGLAFLFGLPVPFTTLQILWINLVTDSFPALALCAEKPNPNVLKQKPRSGSNSSLKSAIKYSLSLAFITVILCFGLYLWGLMYSIEKARTLLFCAAVIMELVLAISIRSRERFWQNPRAFFANKMLWISILVSLVLQFCLFLNPLTNIFKVKVLGFNEILILIAFAILTFIGAEWIRSRHDKKNIELTK